MQEEGAFGQHQAQQIRHRRGGLAARADALRAGDALEDHGEAWMAQVDRAAGKQVRGADRGQRHADRADGEALVGEADDIHGDGVGIGGERFARQRCAPGRVLLPGGAVGAAGPVAAGPCRVDRGAAGEVREVGGAGSAVGDGEGAEQGGLEGERAVGRGIRRGGQGGSDPALAPPGDAPPALLKPARGSRSGSGRSKSATSGRLEHMFSVRKVLLSDGTETGAGDAGRNPEICLPRVTHLAAFNAAPEDSPCRVFSFIRRMRNLEQPRLRAEFVSGSCDSVCQRCVVQGA